MKYKLDVNSILWKGVVGGRGVGGVGEVVALWSCGGLSSVLLLDGAALCGWGVGPSGLVAGFLPRGTEMRV